MTIPPLDELLTTIGRHDASPLARVGTAVGLADDLGSLGDRLVTHYVTAAREAGCSWSQIGAQLGVSKQAAQQGFVAPAGKRRFGRRGRHFARLTDQARAAVKVAHEQAHALHHSYIGTEHLLLGLLADDGGVAGAVLRGCGVTPAGVLSQLEAGDARPRSGHLPFTKRAKKVMELAVEAAEDGAIGTEHLLLGLIDEGEGLACEILGADLPDLRRAVLDAIPPDR